VSNDVTVRGFTSSAFAADPFALYDQIRETSHAYKSDEIQGVCVVTHYDDVMEILRNPETYSSVFAAVNQSSRPSVQRVLDRAYPEAEMLVTADDPAHKYHASIVKPYFAPRRVRQLGDAISSIAVQLCRSIEAGEIEFVSEYSAKLSCGTIGAVMGIPISGETTEIIFRGSAANATFFGATSEALPEHEAIGIAEDYVEFQHYVADQIKERMANPGDDLISEIVTSQPVDGFAPLRFEEMLSLVLLIIAAGNETTASLIGSAMLRIASDKVVQDALRSDPAFLRLFIEETLRIDSPVMLLYRTVVRDTELSGHPLQKGDVIAVAYGAANHDPKKFACPKEFDVQRHNLRSHVAFGFGAHVCMGALLARLETGIALRTFTEEFSSIQLSNNDEPVYSPIPITRTLEKLPLYVKRSPDAEPRMQKERG
jgi:cytochrome P450